MSDKASKATNNEVSKAVSGKATNGKVTNDEVSISKATNGKLGKVVNRVVNNKAVKAIVRVLIRFVLCPWLFWLVYNYIAPDFELPRLTFQKVWVLLFALTFQKTWVILFAAALAVFQADKPADE